jgi:tetratricopeptide (TPR) repeat protein
MKPSGVWLALVGLTFVVALLLYALLAPPDAHRLAERRASVHLYEARGVAQQVLSEYGASLPLRADLGAAVWPISSASALCQRYFNQALRYVIAFDMPRALANFRQAAALNPACAMCAWGEAYSLGQTLNHVQRAENEPRAFAAVLRALHLTLAEDQRASITSPPALCTTTLEHLLVRALLQRYAWAESAWEQLEASAARKLYLRALLVDGERWYRGAPHSSEAMPPRAQLNTHYAEAMRQLAALPAGAENDHVLFLAADALMNLVPWDYWEELADGAARSRPGVRRRMRPLAREARTLLERVLARSPEHAGALHLYIHVTEAGPHPEEAAEAAERLRYLVQGSPHLVHMPSHTFIRQGRYAEAVRSNERAVALPRDEHVFPQHNLDFLVYCLRMVGRREDAFHAAAELLRLTSALLECGEQEPTLDPSLLYEAEVPPERFVVTHLLTAVLFRRWHLVLGTPPPPAARLHHRAVLAFARGMAHLNHPHRFPAQALAELRALRELRLRIERTPLYHTMSYYPAAPMVHLLELELHADLAREGAHGVVASLSSSSSSSASSASSVSASASASVSASASPSSSSTPPLFGLSEVELLEEALRIEDTLPYNEPPLHYRPVSHRLGAALLRERRATDALRVYHECLREYPHDPWVWYGVAQAHAMLGNDEQRHSAEREFRALWAEADLDLNLLDSGEVAADEEH